MFSHGQWDDLTAEVVLFQNEWRIAVLYDRVPACKCCDILCCPAMLLPCRFDIGNLYAQRSDTCLPISNAKLIQKLVRQWPGLIHKDSKMVVWVRVHNCPNCTKLLQAMTVKVLHVSVHEHLWGILEQSQLHFKQTKVILINIKHFLNFLECYLTRILSWSILPAQA